MNIRRIGLIGYGEVGRIFGAGLKDKPGVTAIADKQQWVAEQARAGVFAEVVKDARWQDYADKLIASNFCLP